MSEQYQKSNIVPIYSIQTLEFSIKNIKTPEKFYFLFHQLVLIISDFSAGNTKFGYILHNHKPRRFDEFQEFLQMLEVFGSGYFEDVEKAGAKLRPKQPHSTDAQVALTEVIDCLQAVMNQVDDFSVTEYFNGSNTFRSCLKNLLKVTADTFVQLLKIQEDRYEMY